MTGHQEMQFRNCMNYHLSLMPAIKNYKIASFDKDMEKLGSLCTVEGKFFRKFRIKLL